MKRGLASLRRTFSNAFFKDKCREGLAASGYIIFSPKELKTPLLSVDLETECLVY